MTESEQLTPELRAAEYVLGTLAPDECARLEAQMEQDDQVQREVAYWEQRLGALGLVPAPVEPPPLVWAQVRARTQPPAPVKRRSNTGVWIGFAIAASMAAFALATALSVGLQQKPGAESAPVYASLIQDDKRGLSWLVTANSKPANRLQIVAMGDSYGKAWAGRSLELWLLAPDADPVSLGLLPKQGVSNVKVAPDVAAALAKDDEKGLKLAVSNEPLGGSPTGAPTGKVLYVVALNQRTPFLR